MESLGDGVERVRNAFWTYQTLKRQKNRGQKPLTVEEQQRLKDSPLRNDYLIGRQLDMLEKKLRDAEKKEKRTNSPAAAAVTNRAASTPITNRASTHQSRPTTYANPLASTYVTNSTNSTVHISSFSNSKSR